MDRVWGDTMNDGPGGWVCAGAGGRAGLFHFVPPRPYDWFHASSACFTSLAHNRRGAVERSETSPLARLSQNNGSGEQAFFHLRLLLIWIDRLICNVLF